MSIEKLVEETNNFYKLHWNNEAIKADQPKWSLPWRFIGSIEYPERVGCYALFSDNQLLYIGVAESGLGSRTNAYTRVAPEQFPNKERIYVPASNWADKNLTHMHTIGFPSELWYLPAALEKFLIRKLSPPENTNGK